MSSHEKLIAKCSRTINSATNLLLENKTTMSSVEKRLQTPNLSSLQLKEINKDLDKINDQLSIFSLEDLNLNKSIYRDLLGNDVKNYLELRGVIQSDWLYLAQRLDKKILLDKKKVTHQSKILNEQLLEFESRLQEIYIEIKRFKNNIFSLPLLEVVTQFQTIQRRFISTHNEIQSDLYKLLREGQDFIRISGEFSLLNAEFNELRKLIQKIPLENETILAKIGSLQKSYNTRIPLIEITKCLEPYDYNYIYEKVKQIIAKGKLLEEGSKIDSLGTTDRTDDFLIIGNQLEIKKTKRSDLFKRVLKRFDSIKLSQLSKILEMKDDTELSLFLLDLPESFGFRIVEDMLIIKQEDVLAHIDELVARFDSTEQEKESKS
ncbi:MAG: hypothetical protein ACXAC7_21310 [Candidatus Hodarchaeales archaeon]